MSWIIGEYIRQLPYIKERADINSDSYNNAIIIEKTLDDMLIDGIITEKESNVIWAISAGYSYSETARLLNIHRLTVSEIFKRVTDRISYILGGELTDSAFLERLNTPEPLTDKEISSLFRKGIVRLNKDN